MGLDDAGHSRGPQMITHNDGKVIESDNGDLGTSAKPNEDLMVWKSPIIM